MKELAISFCLMFVGACGGEGAVFPDASNEDGQRQADAAGSSGGVSDAGEAGVSQQNLQSVAEAPDGASIELPSYVVPGDGLLVVRIGARGPEAQSVQFMGQEMDEVASLGIAYGTNISVGMYALPVTAGQTGSIVVDFGFGGTNARGLIASTLVGATRIASMEIHTDGETFTENRTGPNRAEHSITTSEPTLVLSVFCDHGAGIPEVIGAGHVLDAHPTVPEETFHESKVMGGSLAANSGEHLLGYQNTAASGYMDYAMILAAFASD